MSKTHELSCTVDVPLASVPLEKIVEFARKLQAENAKLRGQLEAAEQHVKILNDHRAEYARLRDGMAKVEAIASAIVPNPGCEKNTVELVEDMAHLIQQLRQDKHALLNAR